MGCGTTLTPGKKCCKDDGSGKECKTTEGDGVLGAANGGAGEATTADEVLGCTMTAGGSRSGTG